MKPWNRPRAKHDSCWIRRLSARPPSPRRVFAIMPPMSDGASENRPLSERSAEVSALCEGFADIGRMFAPSAGEPPFSAGVRRHPPPMRILRRHWPAVRHIGRDRRPMRCTARDSGLRGRECHLAGWPRLRQPSGQHYQGLMGQSLKIARFRVLRLPPGPAISCVASDSQVHEAQEPPGGEPLPAARKIGALPTNCSPWLDAFPWRQEESAQEGTMASRRARRRASPASGAAACPGLHRSGRQAMTTPVAPSR